MESHHCGTTGRLFVRITRKIANGESGHTGRYANERELDLPVMQSRLHQGDFLMHQTLACIMRPLREVAVIKSTVTTDFKKMLVRKSDKVHRL